MHRKLGALFALLTVGLIGAFALAGPAQADEHLPHVVADVEDCETASLTFVNPRGYEVTFTYGEDLEAGEDVAVPAGGEVTKELGYAEKSGHHTVHYAVTKTPEQDDRFSDSVLVDCLTDVTPAAPTSTDETCDEPGTITIPRTKGVKYKVDGTRVKPGIYEVDPGTYEVTAQPRKGYELAEGADSAWTLTVAAAEDCEPGPDPSTSPSTEPPTSPSAEPSASTTPPVKVTDGPDDLPTTGFGALPLIIGSGFALIASGAGILLLIARRKGWLYS